MNEKTIKLSGKIIIATENTESTETRKKDRNSYRIVLSSVSSVGSVAGQKSRIKKERKD
ncbi:MAG: hypothetical protein ISS76_20825 [Phycisphaerae bacterium]|nr:hypothetical protein [Phycisphaerae bacterium]